MQRILLKGSSILTCCVHIDLLSKCALTTRIECKQSAEKDLCIITHNAYACLQADLVAYRVRRIVFEMLSSVIASS